MEFSGVRELGYFIWAKATDHIQNGKFFSIFHGGIVIFYLKSDPCFEWILMRTEIIQSLEVFNL